MDKRKYRTVFFDFDGTLVDSLPTLQNVYLGFLKSYGKQGSLDEFAELNGPSLTEIIAILKTRYNLRDSCRNLAESYSQMLLTAYRDDVNAFAGAEDILNFLRKEKLQIGLVTSASRAIVQRIPKIQQLGSLFRSHSDRRYDEACEAAPGNLPTCVASFES